MLQDFDSTYRGKECSEENIFWSPANRPQDLAKKEKTERSKSYADRYSSSSFSGVSGINPLSPRKHRKRRRKKNKNNSDIDSSFRSSMVDSSYTVPSSQEMYESPRKKKRKRKGSVVNETYHSSMSQDRQVNQFTIGNHLEAGKKSEVNSAASVSLVSSVTCNFNDSFVKFIKQKKEKGSPKKNCLEPCKIKNVYPNVVNGNVEDNLEMSSNTSATNLHDVDANICVTPKRKFCDSLLREKVNKRVGKKNKSILECSRENEHCRNVNTNSHNHNHAEIGNNLIASKDGSADSSENVSVCSSPKKRKKKYQQSVLDDTQMLKNISFSQNIGRKEKKKKNLMTFSSENELCQDVRRGSYNLSCAVVENNLLPENKITDFSGNINSVCITNKKKKVNSCSSSLIDMQDAKNMSISENEEHMCLTQRDHADLLNLSPDAFSGCERDITSPSHKKAIKRTAEILEGSIDTNRRNSQHVENNENSPLFRNINNIPSEQMVNDADSSENSVCTNFSSRKKRKRSIQLSSLDANKDKNLTFSETARNLCLVGKHSTTLLNISRCDTSLSLEKITPSRRKMIKNLVEEIKVPYENNRVSTVELDNGGHSENLLLTENRNIHTEQFANDDLGVNGINISENNASPTCSSKRKKKKSRSTENTDNSGCDLNSSLESRRYVHSEESVKNTTLISEDKTADHSECSNRSSTKTNKVSSSVNSEKTRFTTFSGSKRKVPLNEKNKSSSANISNGTSVSAEYTISPFQREKANKGTDVIGKNLENSLITTKGVENFENNKNPSFAGNNHTVNDETYSSEFASIKGKRKKAKAVGCNYASPIDKSNNSGMNHQIFMHTSTPKEGKKIHQQTGHDNEIRDTDSENKQFPVSATRVSPTKSLHDKSTLGMKLNCDSFDASSDTSELSMHVGSSTPGRDISGSHLFEAEETMYDSLLKEAILDENESCHRKELEDLHIVLNHDVPALHSVEIPPCSDPKREQREQLIEMGMKVGRFNKAEDTILMANWERFSKDYGFNDLSIFVNMDQTFNRDVNLKKEFLQFLGNGLPKRSLYQIYRRFVLLCQSLKKGPYTKEEDKVIMKAINKNIRRPYKILSVVLKRTRQSIYKRYQMLNASTEDIECEKSMEKQKWTISFAESVLNALLIVTKPKSVDSLKDVKIPMYVWRDVEKKINIPHRKLRQFWNYRLHTQLFATSPICEEIVFRKIVKWLQEEKPESEKDIKWAKSIHLVSGSTPWFMWEMFRRLRRAYNYDRFKTLTDFTKHLCKDERIFNEKKRYLPRYEVKWKESLFLTVIPDE